MKNNSFEGKLIGISLFTFFMWYLKFNLLIPLFLFCLIFVYLMYKKAPLHYYLTIILFSIMSCQNRIGFLVVEYPLIGLLFIYVLYQCVKTKKLVLGNLFIPLLLYTLYTSITLLWSPRLIDGLDGLMGMLEGYLIYFIITNHPFQVKKSDFDKISIIVSFVLLTLTFEVLTVYYQNGFIRVLENKNLLDLNWAISNIFAVIYVLLIPVGLYKYLNKKKLYYRYLLIDAVNLIGLILSLSRGAYLGALIALTLFGILFIRKHVIRRYGGVIAFFILVFFVYKETILKFISIRLSQHHILYNSNRDVLYHLGWDRFSKHMVFGEGVGSSKTVIHQVLGTPYAHYHNFTLQIAATLGIVGLILLMINIFHWFKILDRFKEPFVLCIVLSILGMLIHQLVDVSFNFYFAGVYFYLLIGIIERYRSKDPCDSLTMKVKYFV